MLTTTGDPHYRIYVTGPNKPTSVTTRFDTFTECHCCKLLQRYISQMAFQGLRLPTATTQRYIKRQATPAGSHRVLLDRVTLLVMAPYKHESIHHLRDVQILKCCRIGVKSAVLRDSCKFTKTKLTMALCRVLTASSVKAGWMDQMDCCTLSHRFRLQCLYFNMAHSTNTSEKKNRRK